MELGGEDDRGRVGVVVFIVLDIGGGFLVCVWVLCVLDVGWGVRGGVGMVC